VSDRDDHRDAPDQAPAPDGPVEEPRASARALSVLLVDHDPAHVAIVSRALQGDGHRVAAVGSLAEARRRLAEEHDPPLTVVVEHDLPDGPGVALLEHATGPVVVMSAGGDPRLAVSAVKAGAFDYVVKNETSLERMHRTVVRAFREWSDRRARLLAEASLARNERHLRYAQAVASVGSLELALTPEGASHGSPVFLALLDVDEPPDAPTFVADHVHPEDVARVRAFVNSQTAGAERRSLRFRLRRTDGTPRHVRFVGRVVDPDEHDQDTDGGRRLVGAVIDVSDQEAARQELAAREDELQAAHRMSVLGRIATGIAHDFNNLLMGIQGGADIALTYLNGDHPAHRYVDAVRSSARTGIAVVARLLTFSERELDAEDDGRAATADVDQVIRGGEAVLRTLLDDDIHLHLALDAGGAHVAATGSALEEALVNLAMNAREAMPNGGHLVIATQLARRDGAGDAGGDAPDDGADDVLLTVADDGIGMTEAILSKAFEPFFSTRHGSASGLGLSMVQRTVERAGGTVRLDTEVGLGTVVRVRLPRVPPEAAAAATAGRTIGERPESPIGRLLLVEDHERSRMALAELLEESGWEVAPSRDAQEALETFTELVGNGGVDAVVSDLTLPDEPGDALVARLRKARPDLPVLFLTGRDVENEPQLRELLRDGRTGLLTKPVELEVLTRELEALVRRR